MSFGNLASTIVFFIWYFFIFITMTYFVQLNSLLIILGQFIVRILHRAITTTTVNIKSSLMQNKLNRQSKHEYKGLDFRKTKKNNLIKLISKKSKHPCQRRTGFGTRYTSLSQLFVIRPIHKTGMHKVSVGKYYEWGNIINITLNHQQVKLTNKNLMNKKTLFLMMTYATMRPQTTWCAKNVLNVCITILTQKDFCWLSNRLDVNHQLYRTATLHDKPNVFQWSKIQHFLFYFSIKLIPTWINTYTFVDVFYSVLILFNIVHKKCNLKYFLLEDCYYTS